MREVVSVDVGVCGSAAIVRSRNRWMEGIVILRFLELLSLLVLKRKLVCCTLNFACTTRVFAMCPLRWKSFEIAGVSPVTRTRWALSKNGVCICPSYAGTPSCNNFSSSMKGTRKESRSLGCDGPGHSPKGKKLSELYL